MKTKPAYLISIRDRISFLRWLHGYLVAKRSMRASRKHLRASRKVVKNQAKSLEATLCADPSTIVRVVYDNSVSPPTFGDLLNVIMLARLLAFQGHRVDFIILDDGKRREDWTALNQFQQEAFVQEQLELAHYFLPLNANIQVSRPSKNFIDQLDLPNCFTIFADKIRDRESIYGLAPLFLQVLANACGPTLPEGFLVGRDTLGNSSPEIQAARPYVVWHVRQGLWGNVRDTTAAEIESDYTDLTTLFPHHNVVVVSSRKGIDFAMNVLSNLSRLRSGATPATKLFAQPDDGFINAVPWVLGADFYFQRRGGGAGQIAIFSTVPYLYISHDRTAAALFDLVGERLVSWARADQVFALRPYSGDIVRIPDVLTEVRFPASPLG